MSLPEPTVYNKGQQTFIQQRAHSLLVEWCDEVMLGGDMKARIRLDPDNPYVRYAADRKAPWIKEKNPGEFFMLGAGWSAATSFLKR